MGHQTVRVGNQLGEAGCVCTDDTVAVVADSGKQFNVFKIVADAVFTDVTSDLITNVDVLEGPTFTAGTEWVFPGVTGYTLASGEVIAYYRA